MMVHHPHLLADVQSVVAVTDLSLAGTRDTIRLLAWLRSNAPAAKLTVVAHPVATGTASEVSRRQFEASIDSPIDHVRPYELQVEVAAATTRNFLPEAAGRRMRAAPVWTTRAGG